MACPGFIELSYQFSLSGIPKRYYNLGDKPLTLDGIVDLIRKDNPNVSYDLLIYKHSFLDNIEAGVGLYLYSYQTGNGKTTTACAIAADYIRAVVGQRLGRGQSNIEQLALYVNVPYFIGFLKLQFKDTSEGESALEKATELTERMRKVPLLILDDIGAEKPSDSVRERLYSIIDDRTDGLTTIYTSNMSLDELELSLGKRIRSRIEGSTIPIHFSGYDRRVVSE